MNVGEKGDELAAFVCEETSGEDAVGRQIMASRVVRLLVERNLYKLPKPNAVPKPVSPMSDVEARAFRKTIVPQWKYRGEVVDDVPFSYLCAITDPDPWLAEVKRYLSNADVQREMED